MSKNEPNDFSDREAQINALLDGELDAEATAELKAAAAEDSRLAQAIVEAWQLQKGMDDLRLEKAPARLTRALKRIPREQKAASRKAWLGVPRWAAATGLASVCAVALAMMMNLSGPAPGDAPSVPQVVSGPDQLRGDELRAEQARQDLVIAFHYLDKAGFRVGKEIHEVLQGEIAAPVKDNLIKHIPYTEQSRKEKQA
jgi:anti-sigma factor RsiW